APLQRGLRLSYSSLISLLSNTLRCNIVNIYEVLFTSPLNYGRCLHCKNVLKACKLYEVKLNPFSKKVIEIIEK
ncbi:MAG: hypothetical protein RMI93_05495, partial [Caldimicrobium sp.]|nr:hypothetical protein [Caldimicrobium sp.]MDW8183040.1 hypothetical protein [Caldimicrobium sp.]